MKTTPTFLSLLFALAAFFAGAYAGFWQGHGVGWNRGYDAAVIQYHTGEDVRGTGKPNPFNQ